MASMCMCLYNDAATHEIYTYLHTLSLRDALPSFSRVPQSQYEYSNFGYALLGRIVTNASGMAYTDYVRRTILTPLGMASSGYDAPKAPKTRTALGYRWEKIGRAHV